ncbi:MAG: GNAT family N-acetyltransferase [Armatimonadetes bacterium]|nr:GNAT family N-acetyltransferase [Armatimonadota bacterium]
MTVIRRIQDAESEPFLDLLCTVFQLDMNRARPVFYDPVLFDLTRKWALFHDGQMCSILTTTGLTFGWGRCIGIAGVATVPSHRGKGFGQRLLETVLEHAEREGEGPAMLFAHEQTLYRRLGFRLVDEVVRGPVAADRHVPPSQPLDNREIRSFYETWCAQSPDRLVRTADRWRYWGLACRMCESFLGGYFCAEPGLIREAVCLEPADRWPVSPGTEWYGLRSVTKACQVPIKKPKVELLFMTRQVPGEPQMFMTDQF